jgi:hypothetical protein
MPVSLGETTITRATCASEDPRDLPRIARDLQRDQITRVEICPNNSSACGLVAIRPAERSRPSATIATSQKSR